MLEIRRPLDSNPYSNLDVSKSTEFSRDHKDQKGKPSENKKSKDSDEEIVKMKQD